MDTRGSETKTTFGGTSAHVPNAKLIDSRRQRPWTGTKNMNEPKPNEAETGAAVGCSALLAEVEQALEDWIVTYASDHCDPEQVRKAWDRLMCNGGTLAYVTDLRERVHAANNDYASNGNIMKSTTHYGYGRSKK
jgi:hypothetical protein